MDYSVLLSGFGVVIYAHPVCVHKKLFSDESFGQAPPGLPLDDSSNSKHVLLKINLSWYLFTVTDKSVHFYSFARKAPVIFTMWRSVIPTGITDRFGCTPTKA